MPPPLNLQNVIAFIWDFDKTLTPAYMQQPLFDHYGVDGAKFWAEVNSLPEFYGGFDLKVSKDTAYLEHTLQYVRDGRFGGLTNQLLQQFGADVLLNPGMPDFMQDSKEFIANNPRYKSHGITLEHYVVSTGFRKMIEGNPIRQYLDGVYACELLPDPVTVSGDKSTFDPNGVLTQIGFTIDNTTKTRAVFEINKGVNKLQGVDVNSLVAEEDRRVPFAHMVYVADGPSDIPVFSVVRKFGGQTLAVHTEDPASYDAVQTLQETGRVHHTASADYRQGSDAYRWLMRALTKIADKISVQREQSIANIVAPPSHITA
ncbi:HAD family hydrolase [Mycobacteroides abscessus]|uniref:HAD family hydrolase n=1 Tax=Mycobacteroides abscessus TaxID=36809 RepID=UPI0009A6480E|nr:HAD family hydrolase [Mycobacteroides abscessus]SLG36779.1 haloacid dehalogenase-like hydrolase [Mycobacteroides abscessus subsp. massiliense]